MVNELFRNLDFPHREILLVIVPEQSQDTYAHCIMS